MCSFSNWSILFKVPIRPVQWRIQDFTGGDATPRGVFVAILVRMTLSAKKELIHFPNLSSRDPNCQNNIQLLRQQFEKFSVYGDINWHCKVLGTKQTSEWHFTLLDLKVTVSHTIIILQKLVCQLFSRSNSHPIHEQLIQWHLRVIWCLLKSIQMFVYKPV